MGGKDVCDWKFVEARDVPVGPWSKHGENNTFVLQRRGANLFMVDRNNAYGARRQVIDQRGLGGARQPWLHEGENGPRGLFGCDGVHATKIERTFTEKAGAAFDLMAQDGACRGAGTGQSRFG